MQAILYVNERRWQSAQLSVGRLGAILATCSEWEPTRSDVGHVLRVGTDKERCWPSAPSGGRQGAMLATCSDWGPARSDIGHVIRVGAGKERCWQRALSVGRQGAILTETRVYLCKQIYYVYLFLETECQRK